MPLPGRSTLTTDSTSLSTVTTQKIRAAQAQNQAFLFIAEILDVMKQSIDRLELTARASTASTDAAAERAAIGVYSKAEMDAFLAGKAATVHAHSSISITGTTGTVAHVHTGTVS
jgi:hypothetical protein